jgi:hypothetical protein
VERCLKPICQRNNGLDLRDRRAILGCSVSEAPRPKGQGLPGKVVFFYNVALGPVLKGGACGARAGQGLA